MDRNVRQEITDRLSNAPVVLFMKGSKSMPQCGFSAAAVGMLTELGVKFQDVNVLADPEMREGIKRFSDWPTIPQLYVKGEFVGGSDIMREMHERGELAEMMRDVAVA